MTNYRNPKTREQIVLELRCKKDKKFVRNSSYKHVSVFEYKGEIYYKARFNKYKFQNFYLTEKEAAIAIDSLLINKNEKPVNILKSTKQ